MERQIIRHGELILRPVDELPKNVKLINSKLSSYVAAHSESGHHHVLEAEEPVLSVYEHEGLTYLSIERIMNLVHEKSGPDVHAPHVVAPGLYEIVIKHEYDYFSKHMRKVQD